MNRLVNSTGFSYTYMVTILMYILLCGYFLIFAGSLLIEAILQGWYQADATETDAYSFLLGYLYGFPSLLGIVGGIAVMSSPPKAWFRFKVLLFIPAAVWSTLLVLDLFRYPLSWTFFTYHFIAMCLCLFVLIGVIVKTPIPYLNTTVRK
ncbi:MAG: hypothetical protein ACYC9O_14050 [Candidatus Latescibacterota bacterium]